MGSSKQPPPGAGLTVLNLGKPGLYRVKVYPAAWRTFADALHEWWLQIADGSPERPAKRRSRLSSQGPVELRAPDPG
jgi:hypothetical protein